MTEDIFTSHGRKLSIDSRIILLVGSIYRIALISKLQPRLLYSRSPPWKKQIHYMVAMVTNVATD